MAQMTIYLDDDTLALARDAARDAGMSRSAWVAKLIRQNTRQRWPQEFLDLAGAWPDMPTAEELRAGQGIDAPREEL